MTKFRVSYTIKYLHYKQNNIIVNNDPKTKKKQANIQKMELFPFNCNYNDRLIFDAKTALLFKTLMFSDTVSNDETNATK